MALIIGRKADNCNKFVNNWPWTIDWAAGESHAETNAAESRRQKAISEYKPFASFQLLMLAL